MVGTTAHRNARPMFRIAVEENYPAGLKGGPNLFDRFRQDVLLAFLDPD